MSFSADGFEFEGDHFCESAGENTNFRSRDAHCRFSFGLGEWTDSSSDEEVMELERPTKRLKVSVSRARAQDHWPSTS